MKMPAGLTRKRYLGDLLMCIGFDTPKSNNTLFGITANPVRWRIIVDGGSITFWQPLSLLNNVKKLPWM
jgi:hypothetical protein